MMNSVHEPGSQTMSKNRLMNSTESNRAKNRLSVPSAQPTGPATRLGRAPCRAPRAHAVCAPACRLRPRACHAPAAPLPARSPTTAPQTRGSVDYPSTSENTCECRVTRHFSQKSGRVSFVRGALPKYKTCIYLSQTVQYIQYIQSHE